jgi:hypothetical protein
VTGRDQSHTFRPEDELLLCCARVDLDPEAISRIRQLAAEPIDWSYLSWSAEMHGVLPLLAWHINACCPESVPVFTREALQTYFRENARHGVDAKEWLSRMLAQLDDAGIQALPLRGPSVAALLYHNVALRQLTDIALLVRERDFRRATELFYDEGCSPSFAYPGGVTAKERTAIKSSRGCVLGARDIRVPVELRYEIMPARFRVPFDIERLFAPPLAPRAVAMAPSPEHLLVILCLEGARQLWKEMATLCDVAELIRRHQSLDWNAIGQLARAEECESVLFLGLLLAEQRLGVPLPARIASDARANYAARKLAFMIDARPFTTSRRPTGLAERIRFQLPLRRRFRDKFMQALGVMTPGPNDVPAIPTPASFDFIFYLVRPFRFCVEQLRRLTRARPMRPQWAGTPPEVVDRMLTLANVGPHDLVVDLGCGEGRIVVHAAQRYGARGLGIDIDNRRVLESREHARRERVHELVKIERMDAFDANLEEATVVALFMSSEWNDRIATKLADELPPGARVVSWNIDIAGWHPQQVDILQVDDEICRVYLWEIDRQRRLD